MATAITMAVAALLFLWDPLLAWPADRLLAGGDITAQFAPWLAFTLDSLRRDGTLPLWNPYLFGGVPYAANSQAMLFYPFTYLGLLMPLARAMALTLAIHTWLAGLGMYGWLRALGATHAGAALAGFAYAFTGAFSLRLGMGQYNVVLQLAWWPLSFWALHSAFERGAWRAAIPGSFPLAMGLLSSHAVTCLFLYIALGAYTLWAASLAYRKSWRDGARLVGLAAITVSLSLGLAAVQYLPLLNFARLSARVSASTLSLSSRFSMPIGHLVALLVPDFFGEVIQTGYWSVEGHQEITHYVGVFIFFLALAGTRLGHNRHILFFLALAVGALVLQLGPDGVLFVFFYRFLPGFTATRAPGRAGLIYTFALISAAGLAWSELERAAHSAVQRALDIFSSTFTYATSVLIASASLLAFILYATFKESGPAWPWHSANQLVRFLVLFWASMAIFAAWKNQRSTPRTLYALAMALVLLDLWSYGLKAIRPADDPMPAAWSSITSQAQGTPGYRVAVEDLEFFSFINGALSYRVRSSYGYDSLIPAHYQMLLDSASGYSDRVYDLLNVKHVVTRQPLPELALRLDTGELKIYERPAALPRAFIVHAAIVEADEARALAALHADDFHIERMVTLPAAPPCALSLPGAAGTAEADSAQVIGEGPNFVELATRSTSPGLLVLSEVDYPGWQASVDGQPAQVLRADTALRAICLPAGSHGVRFDFQPRDLAAGALISCLALGVLAAALVHGLVRRTCGTRPVPHAQAPR